jgi:hypothetical protein
MAPSPNGPNGRGAGGRFAANNRFGKGNPHARETAARQAALRQAITPEDVGAVGRKLVEAALEGSIPAAKLVLSYAVGKPVQYIHLTDETGVDVIGAIVAVLDAHPDAKAAVINRLRELADE